MFYYYKGRRYCFMEDLKKTPEICPKCGAPMAYPDIEGEDVIIRCSNEECSYEIIHKGEAKINKGED